MATTLQIAIEKLQAKCDKCSVKDCQSCKEQKMIIGWLKESLPDEETIIRDAWKAALDWDLEVHTYPEKVFAPDLETYITNLKK